MSKPAHGHGAELQALLQLMEEEDAVIWKSVRRKLVELGEGAAAALLRAADDTNPLISVRARSVLEEINSKVLEGQFQALAETLGSASSLEDGVFLLPCFAYPGYDSQPYRRSLDEMAADIRKRLRRAREPDEQIEAVNFQLFEVLGFRGNRENYYDPDNSYMNRVLERKLGIPISLSVLYLLICRRLGLPVVGIGMPAHFLLRYDSPDYQVYIDAFGGGRLLARHDCAQLLASFGFSFREEYLQPSSDAEILIRMLRNLAQIYANGGEEQRASRLNRYVEVLEKRRR